MTTGILLAAGAGRRFGGAKLLHPGINGEALGLAALRPLQAVSGRVIAVVAPGQPRLAALFAQAGADVVECAQAHRGLGASLACGVRAAPAGPWLVALADMPRIQAATIAAVAAALAAGAPLAAPAYRGRRGHPVGFAARFFPALSALDGDEGARGLLQAHAAELTLVPTDDPGVLIDIDTPADLARLAPAAPIVGA